MATLTKRVGRNGRKTWQATVRRKDMARSVSRAFTHKAEGGRAA